MTSYRDVRFDDTGPRRFFGGGESRTDTVRSIVAGASIAAMLLGAVAWFLHDMNMDYKTARDKTTLCLAHSRPPRAVLALLDETDTLAGGSGPRFLQLIRRIQTDLPKNGRLTIVPFGGDLRTSLSPTFDVCSPGRGLEAAAMSEGKDAVERDYDAKFQNPLDKVASQLAATHESALSPITAQIERATNDPAIGWVGDERELVIMTDGLENTYASQIYAGKAIALPAPPAGLLEGITVRYYELTNPARSELQTMAVRAAWKRWFEAAGANVKIYAPGFASPDR